MIVKDVMDILEALAPTEYAEDFDNTGLLVGHEELKVTGILITLDTLEAVVDEAIARQCNLIISFHPIIFSGLKKLTAHTYVERTVMKAIRNDIAIYATHTALDNAWGGVSAGIAGQLGLEDRQVLIPKKGVIRKLSTYVPKAYADTVKKALFQAGAGHIGRYSHCSFSVEGTGSFQAEKGAQPKVGQHGMVHYEPETQLQLVFTADRERAVLKALQESHPYEEVAYEISVLENQHQQLGLGMVGTLAEPMEEKAFLQYVKQKMQASVIRHAQLREKPIRKVAVLGGSGAFAIGPAIRAGADALVTSDLKYHQFFEASGKLLLMDIGHFESEQFTKNLLYDYLTEKIPNFAVNLSESITNPIRYYY